MMASWDTGMQKGRKKLALERAWTHRGEFHFLRRPVVKRKRIFKHQRIFFFTNLEVGETLRFHQR